MCKSKNMSNTGGIILAGGEGSRMMSSVYKPFMHIGNGKTCAGNASVLLVDSGLDYCDEYSVVTNTEQKALCREKVKALPSGNILMQDKNLGYVGAMAMSGQNAQNLCETIEYVIILPGDAYFGNHEAICEALNKMVAISKKTGRPLVAGEAIGDAQAMTGFGVIKVDKSDEIDGSYGIPAKDKNGEPGFVEKPSLREAERIMRQHKTYASTGVYVIPVELLKKEYPMETLLSDLANGLCATDKKYKVPYFILKLGFRVMPMDAEWSDLGTMRSLYEIQSVMSVIGERHRNSTLSIEKSDVRVRTNCRSTFFVSDVPGVTIYGTNTKDCTLAAITKHERLCVTAFPFVLDQAAGLITKIFNGEELTDYEAAAYEILRGKNNGCTILSTNLMNEDREDAPIVATLGMQNVTFALNEVSSGRISVIISAQSRENCIIDMERIELALRILQTKEIPESVTA